ncbi:YegP family protein [Acuticoccus sp. I52.16.1]|uniref:YegP family protein n=1 Tax=Acuticoccus sp. I52.16.1 TaxID=2928472 RepID=UPI001FD4792C|nr:YegP family protein [Acuticoccus sp. I52.16.1]UOM32867.1 YegP family protein [Acuticoccus sp. I52.16.1]
MATKKDQIQYYEDKAGEWRWRMVDADGTVIGAASEGYKDKADCEKNAKRGKNAKDKWEFYEDKKGAWRWRRMASNGQIVGAAPSGFKTRGDAEANAGRQGYAG